MLKRRISRQQLQAARLDLARLESFPGDAPFVLLGATIDLEESTPETSKVEPREFIGMCAVYGNEFLYLDRDRWEIRRGVCEQGMFAESVAEINARAGIAKGNVPVLWSHYDLMGRTLDIEELPTGLMVHGRITDEATALSRYAHVVAGAARGMSVGFNILAKTVETDADGDELDRLTKAELREATLCLWGANPLAGVQVAASAAVRGQQRTELTLSPASITALAADLARLTTASPKADAIATADTHLLAEFGARLETLEALAGLRR